MRFMFILLICITGGVLASADVCETGTPGVGDAELTELDSFNVNSLGGCGSAVGMTVPTSG